MKAEQILELAGRLGSKVDASTVGVEVATHVVDQTAALSYSTMVLTFVLADAFLRATGGFYTLEQLHGHDTAVTDLAEWDKPIEQEYARRFGKELGGMLAAYSRDRVKMNLHHRGLLSHSPMLFEVPSLQLSRNSTVDLKDLEKWLVKPQYATALSKMVRDQAEAIRVIVALAETTKATKTAPDRMKMYFLIAAYENAISSFANHAKRLIHNAAQENGP